MKSSHDPSKRNKEKAERCAGKAPLNEHQQTDFKATNSNNYSKQIRNKKPMIVRLDSMKRGREVS